MAWHLVGRLIFTVGKYALRYIGRTAVGRAIGHAVTRAVQAVGSAIARAVSSGIARSFVSNAARSVAVRAIGAGASRAAARAAAGASRIAGSTGRISSRMSRMSRRISTAGGQVGRTGSRRGTGQRRTSQRRTTRRRRRDIDWGDDKEARHRRRIIRDIYRRRRRRYGDETTEREDLEAGVQYTASGYGEFINYLFMSTGAPEHVGLAQADIGLHEIDSVGRQVFITQSFAENAEYEDIQNIVDWSGSGVHTMAAHVIPHEEVATFGIFKASDLARTALEHQLGDEVSAMQIAESFVGAQEMLPFAIEHQEAALERAELMSNLVEQSMRSLAESERDFTSVVLGATGAPADSLAEQRISQTSIQGELFDAAIESPYGGVSDVMAGFYAREGQFDEVDSQLSLPMFDLSAGIERLAGPRTSPSLVHGELIRPEIESPISVASDTISGFYAGVRQFEGLDRALSPPSYEPFTPAPERLEAISAIIGDIERQGLATEATSSFMQTTLVDRISVTQPNLSVSNIGGSIETVSSGYLSSVVDGKMFVNFVSRPEPMFDRIETTRTGSLFEGIDSSMFIRQYDDGGGGAVQLDIEDIRPQTKPLSYFNII